MTYYPDLSMYTYISNVDTLSLNVGWLDKAHDYPKCVMSEEFISRLWTFCHQLVFETRGYHSCNLCNTFDTGELQLQREGEILFLGSAEIRVIGNEGIVYAAPNLIYHYVTEHCYCPPYEFVRAVIEGPLPGSKEYNTIADLRGWDYEWQEQ